MGVATNRQSCCEAGRDAAAADSGFASRWVRTPAWCAGWLSGKVCAWP
jgi:hypothetical protein